MRVVSSLALLYVFRMLGLFMVFPIMMIYGRDYSGSTAMLLGIALGLYGLTQAVFQVPMGLLSDIWGRKNVIAMGLLLFALGSLVGALADSVWELLVARLLQGAGAIAAAILALLSDLTSDKSRTKYMAIIGVSIGFSFAVALFLGPLLAQKGGLSLVFWVSFALALLGVLVLLFVVPSSSYTFSPSPEIKTRAKVFTLLKDSVTDFALLRLNLAIFCLHFVLTATFVIAPLLLESAGLASEYHWHYYLPIMLLAFIGMVPFMYLSERRGKMRPVMLLAIVCLAVSEVVLGAFGHGVLAWSFSLLLFFIAFNLLEATLPSLISKLAPACSKGTALGVYSTCQFMGAAAGGIVGGILIETVGMQGVVWLCVTVCAIWLCSAFYVRPPAGVPGT